MEGKIQSSFDSALSQKQWTFLICKILNYLRSNYPNVDPAFFKQERQLLPKNFTTGPAMFCYPFRGTFLPSGSGDGQVWKPSQGAKTISQVTKRYFYAKENKKIKRQVIWIEGDPGWCFLDYRFNLKGKICLKDALIPPDFHLRELVALVEQSNSSPLDSLFGDDEEDDNVSYEPEPKIQARERPAITETSAAHSTTYHENLLPPSPLPVPREGETQAHHNEAHQHEQQLVSADYDFFPPGENPNKGLLNDGTEDRILNDFEGNPNLFDLEYAKISPPSPLGSFRAIENQSTVTAEQSTNTDNTNQFFRFGRKRRYSDTLTPPSSPSTASPPPSSPFLSSYFENPRIPPSPPSSLPTPSPPSANSSPNSSLSWSPFGSFSAPSPWGQIASSWNAFSSSASNFNFSWDPSQFANLAASHSLFQSRMSWSSAFDSFSSWMLNHLVGYDMVIDLVSQNIVSQLLCNRLIFAGIDPRLLLEKFQQSTISKVDLREFPGALVSNFLEWLWEFGTRMVGANNGHPPSHSNSSSHNNPHSSHNHHAAHASAHHAPSASNSPPLFCVVCGKERKQGHDDAIHAKFYAYMDQSFVENLKKDATSIWEFIKHVVAFLLRHPNLRQSFQCLISDYLHCPFCAGRGGQHDQKLHEEWRRGMGVDYTITVVEPPTNPGTSSSSSPNCQHHISHTSQSQHNVNVSNQPHNNPNNPMNHNPNNPMNPMNFQLMTDEKNNIDFVNRSFEYIMEKMPYQIPSFLFNFNMNNVRSFMESLITVWRTIRLTF